MSDQEIEEKLEKIMPQAIGVVVVQDDQKINLTPINWQATSTKYETPLTVCVGLSNSSYSLKVLKKTKEFTFAYPTKAQLKDVLYCGTVSGQDEDKLKYTNFIFLPSKKIKTPTLKDSVISFECQVQKVIKQDNFSIVIGKVLNISTSDKKVADKIYSFGGQNYGSIKEISIDKVGRN